MTKKQNNNFGYEPSIAKRPVYTPSNRPKPDVLQGSWIKCDNCGEIAYVEDIKQNQFVCLKCDKHFRVSALDRLEMIIDGGIEQFEEFDKNMISENPLEYPDYEQKISLLIEKNKINEAVITGKCKINGIETVVCIMDGNFLMGSMGSVVGEKITRAIEKSTESKIPLIIFSVSGGARMQEGIISLMQMAKTSAAIAKHNESGNLYISILTDPTTGGVTASFAMLGDIIIAERGALIGFAGKRVIEQTIKQKLPTNFQSAEFMASCGFVDLICERSKLKNLVWKVLLIQGGGEHAE
jgi:acetyl-CoA carboxylase carboxyl transferase subunit beta